MLSNCKEYLRKSGKSRIGRFLVIFGVILAMFFTSQSYHFDAIAHTWAPLGVEWLCKILWKSYRQFLRNLKFSLEGRKKKGTIAWAVENFFRLLKTFKYIFISLKRFETEFVESWNSTNFIITNTTQKMKLNSASACKRTLYGLYRFQSIPNISSHESVHTRPRPFLFVGNMMKRIVSQLFLHHHYDTYPRKQVPRSCDLH